MIDFKSPLDKLTQKSRFERIKTLIETKTVVESNVFVLDQISHGDLVEETIKMVDSNVNVVRYNVFGEFGYDEKDLIDALENINEFLKTTNTFTVINCSWSIGQNKKVEEKIIDCQNNGGIFVCSLGDESKEYRHLPGTIENVITVGSLNTNLEIDDRCNTFESVDCYVPCRDIKLESQTVSGSSFGCAMVSAALCKLVSYTDNPLQIFRNMIYPNKTFILELFMFIINPNKFKNIVWLDEYPNVRNIDENYEKALMLSKMFNVPFKTKFDSNNIPIDFDKNLNIVYWGTMEIKKSYESTVTYDFGKFEISSPPIEFIHSGNDVSYRAETYKRDMIAAFLKGI